MFVDYHFELFTSSAPSDFTEILEAIQPIVTQSMNFMLVKEF